MNTPYGLRYSLTKHIEKGILMIQRMMIAIGLLITTTLTPLVSAATPKFKVTLNGPNVVITALKLHFNQPIRLMNLSSNVFFTNPTNDCHPLINGGCVAPLSDVSPAVIGISGPSTHYTFNVCINGQPPYACEKFDIRFAYITNRGITVNDNTGQSQLSVCPIVNGVFTPCTAQTLDSFTDPSGILLNASGTTAYIINTSSDTLSQCTLNNGSVVSCDTISGILHNSTSHAFGPTGSLYVTNNVLNTVTICTVDTSTGEIMTDDCTPSETLFFGPTGIAVPKLGATAYIVNSTTHTVSVCSLLSHGLIDTCTDVNPNTTFSTPSAIAVDEGNARAYILNTGNNTVSVCIIANRTLASCRAYSDETLDNPVGIVLNRAGTMAYLTNANTNAISECPVGDGVFGPCTLITDPTFGIVSGITLSNE